MLRFTRKVQFADDRFVMPFYFIDQVFCRLFVPHDVVVGSEEVLERQFVPPHAGSDKVAAIHRDHFQMVFGRIHIMNGKIQLAILELLRNPLFYFVIGFAARFDGFLVKLHRVLLVDLREEGQPSQSDGKGIHVGRMVEFGKFLGSRGPLGVERTYCRISTGRYGNTTMRCCS